MILQFIIVILGFALLIKGADLLVDGASDIAKKFKIPEIIIAMTIVSIGTSLPELVVSLSSAIEGHSDIAIGNVVGSNISNLFLILGICSIITPLVYKKQTKYIENMRKEGSTDAEINEIASYDKNNLEANHWIFTTWFRILGTNDMEEGIIKFPEIYTKEKSFWYFEIT